MEKSFIPYVNLGAQSKNHKQELMDSVSKVIDSGNYILGNEVKEFEKEFSNYCGTTHSIGVANGTCALHLSLKSLGIGAGDEVITAPNSFIASASSIALTGARPVFADIRPDLNIDPVKIEAAVTSRTKAIIPVHLTGRPAQMDAILSIAKKHSLAVIEDCAQAVGAKWKNKRVGSMGDVGCFSLHPLKNLYAFGDAGMVVAKDLNFTERLTKARSHGFKNRTECDFWSFNCRLDEMQAAMLRVQLCKLDEWTETRRQLAFFYNENLKKYVVVPEEQSNEYCVYQTYMIRADRRDSLSDYLIQNGVDVKIHYPIPIHMQKAAESLGHKAGDFPETMKAAGDILSLPLYPGLKKSQQERIVETIRNFYAS